MAPLAFPEIRRIPPLLRKAPETTIMSALPSESGISNALSWTFFLMPNVRPSGCRLSLSLNHQEALTYNRPSQELLVICLSGAWRSHRDPHARKGELTQYEGDGDELDVAVTIQSELLKNHLLFVREGHPGGGEGLGARMCRR